MKIKTRQDIVIGHNIILKSIRKLDFVGTDKYDKELFVSVNDIEIELFKIKNEISRKCEAAKTYCKAIELIDIVRRELDNASLSATYRKKGGKDVSTK